MNLMKQFNFKYLKENFRKSKIFLVFLLVLLPLLNTIILFTVKNGNVAVYDLGKISGFSLNMLCIVPIILSFTLFGYVFKKKSVDFIGSMPLSRKTIFLTNTIGGIIVITLSFLITCLLIFITSLLVPSIIIPFQVIIDYFILFVTSYIFMFVISNIAISVSGNIATSIVVILLITFLVPFMSMYVNSKNYSYNTVDVTFNCSDCNYDVGLNETNNDTNSEYQTYMENKKNSEIKYTLPSTYISKMFVYSDNINYYTTTAILRTVVLSVIYIILGLYLFKRKELEISETSFKKYQTHILVKTLTFLPIICIVKEALSTPTIASVLIILILLLIYNFIYDLILKKKVDEVLKNIIVFVVTIGLLWLIVSIIPENKQLNNISFKYSDIKNMTVTNNENIKSEQDVKTEFYKTLLEGIFAYKEDAYYSVTANIELKNGEIYKANSSLTEEEYMLLTSQLEPTSNKITDNVAILLDYNYMKLDKDLETLLETSITNPEENNNYGLPITIYKYIDHELITDNYISSINSELNKKVIANYNDILLNYRDTHDISKNNGTISIIDKSGVYTGFMNKGTNNFINNLVKRELNYEEDTYKLQYNNSDGTYYFIINLTSEKLKEFER